MPEKLILTISGMHCASCAKIIESTIEEKQGVQSISVNFESKKVFLEFSKEQISLEELTKEIESLGYSIV